MAIRQYIGARYVTKIYENSLDPSSAEWESSVTYEPLTMVTYNNSSYLSKKDVPASIGNPAANPSYWVVTGAYNGQILNLQNQIDNIDNVEIPNLQSQITSIDNLVINTTLKDKKFVLIGDSYDVTGTWCSQFASKLGLSNTECYSNSDNGARIAQGGSPNFTTLLNAVTTSDDDEITDIILAGGFNDQNESESDIYLGFADFVSACNTKFSNAKIHVSFNGWTVDELNSSSGNYTQAKLFIAYLRYKAACVYNGIDFIEDGIAWAVNQNFNSDYIHPNTNGGKAIAENLICGLIGASHVSLTETISNDVISMNTDLSTSDTLYIANVNKGFVNLRTNVKITFTANSVSFTCGESGGIKLFDCYSPLIKCPNPFIIRVSTYVNTTNGFVNLPNAYIQIYNGEWHLYAIDVNTGGYETITDITRIIITPYSATIPLMTTNNYPVNPFT